MDFLKIILVVPDQDQKNDPVDKFASDQMELESTKMLQKLSWRIQKLEEKGRKRNISSSSSG